MATTSFFISYTGADAGWAEWIAWQLEAAGYTTSIQAWDSRPGNDFVAWMDQQLRDAGRVLVVLSPAYEQATSFTEPEWTTAIGRDPTGRLGVLLLVRVADFTPGGLFRTRGWIDLAGKDRLAAKAALLAGVRQERMKPVQEPPYPGERPPEPTFPGPTEPGRTISNLPARNLNFTGRDDLLRQLAEYLVAGTAAAVVQAQAVHGLGGVGKTQLAIEYVHRHQADYDLIWWITADQPLAIPGQLVALARRLGLPDAPEQAETIRSLWDALRGRGRWLLVFDAAEQLAHLRPLWPPGGTGHVLVTSRNPAWRGLAGPLEVDVLAREQAVAFLARRIGRKDSDTLDALAEVLGDLPLALEQASAYIEETATPIGEYVSLFTNRAGELFDLGQPSTTEQTIATIWALSLERIRSDRPAAQELLTLCAFLAPDDIPRPMLAEHSEQLPQRLREAVADPLRLQQAIGGLRRYSMITATEDSLSVHRLVQAVVRNDMDHHQANQWAVAALAIINAAFPDKGHQFNNWPACARLLPHALAVIRHADEFAGESAVMAALLDKTGLYLWGRAEPSQAQPLLERGLAIREARLGDDHPDTATSLNHLARALHAQGDLNTARSLLERALTIREGRLGKDHPDTAWSLNDLAVVLNNEGDLDRARTLHEQALAIREARRGKDHPTTAISLSNLASVLQAQGNLDYARTLLEKALAIHEARLGKDHPDTATSLGNLASVLEAQGDLDHARTLNEQALAIREARLGKDHPDTAASLGNLASVVRAQGDLDHARTLLERGLAIREAHLGKDHLDTVTNLYNLGVVLAELGRLPASRYALNRALAIYRRRLGPNHPSTIACRRMLRAIR